MKVQSIFNSENSGPLTEDFLSNRVVGAIIVAMASKTAPGCVNGGGIGCTGYGAQHNNHTA